MFIFIRFFYISISLNLLFIHLFLFWIIFLFFYFRTDIKSLFGLSYSWRIYKAASSETCSIHCISTLYRNGKPGNPSVILIHQYFLCLRYIGAGNMHKISFVKSYPWATYKVANGPYPRSSRRPCLLYSRVPSYPSESSALRFRYEASRGFVFEEKSCGDLWWRNALSRNRLWYFDRG